MHHAEKPIAEPVGDPDIALAVDCEAAAVEADLEVLDLARIGGGEPRNVVDAAVADPNPVLLIDGQMERRAKRLARLGAIALADDPTLGQVALREETSWLFSTPRTQTSPLGVTITPCIRPSRPPKVMPSGGVSGLPVLSKTVIDLLP